MFTKKNALQTALQREADTFSPRQPKYISTPHGETSEEHLHLYNKAIFAWSAPQYIQHQKSKRWYFIAAAIATVFVVGAVLLNDWTFALAIIVLAGVYYYLQEHHPPQEIQIVISEMGIKAGNVVYPFSHIQAFWIIYNPPNVKTLNLRLHKKFSHDVVIQLADEDIVEIRQFLCGEITEWEGKTEHLSEIILRLLKL